MVANLGERMAKKYLFFEHAKEELGRVAMTRHRQRRKLRKNRPLPMPIRRGCH